MPKRNWHYVRIACYSAIGVTIGLSGLGQPIPVGRANIVWGFRLAVIGMSLVGLYAADRYGNKPDGLDARLERPETPPILTTKPALAPGTRSISVTYRNTFEATQRCELYIFYHRLGSQIS